MTPLHASHAAVRHGFDRAASAASTLMCVAILLGCMLVAHPVAEAGFIDDWSYLWTAKVLAQTGHLVFNGWSTAMLGWQVYLGALFSRILGYSCTHVRMSVALVSLVCCAVMHRILLRLGHGAWNSSVATLTLSLSVMALPLEVSFMSDMPGLLAVLVCLYGCLRAVQARTDRATLVWLVTAAAANVALGTARQISWLGALVLVPSAALLVRDRRGVRLTAAILWVSSGLAIAACMAWFRHQPYSVPEPVVMLHRGQLPGIGYAAVSAGFLLLPILTAFLWRNNAGTPAYRRRHALFMCVGSAAGVGLAFLHPALYADTAGVILPLTAVPTSALSGSLSPLIQAALLSALGASLAAAANALADTFERRQNLPHRHAHTAPDSTMPLSTSSVVTLLLPYTAACTMLVLTRAVLWSRYLLSLLPMLLILLLHLYRLGRPAPRLRLISAITVAVFAVSSVVVTHDLFARERARVRAEQHYRTTGLPRTALDAGADLDGWVQIQRTGYVNDYRLRVPAGSYRPRTPPSIPLACQSWFLPLAPSIDPRYALTEEANQCLALTALEPVPFRTWLPPHQHAIYIGQFRSAAAP